eukprot:6212276-Pleurochrysis_carterae.AAC.3
MSVTPERAFHPLHTPSYGNAPLHTQGSTQWPMCNISLPAWPSNIKMWQGSQGRPTLFQLALIGLLIQNAASVDDLAGEGAQILVPYAQDRDPFPFGESPGEEARVIARPAQDAVGAEAHCPCGMATPPRVIARPLATGLHFEAEAPLERAERL